MNPKRLRSVVRDGKVVAAGTPAKMEAYLAKNTGTLREYCGPVGKRVRAKRKPVNPPSIKPFLPSETPVKSFPAPFRKDRKTFNKDGKGNIKEVLPIPKDGLFRSPSEGRIKPIMPKRRVPKLKSQQWNGNTMTNHFRIHQIDADHTDWFITFNTPSRKMTREDQITLFLAHSETVYDVKINYDHKYLIIDELNPPYQP